MKKVLFRVSFILLITLMSFTLPTYAGDLMGNAQELLNDVYGRLVAFSTAAAGIGVGTGVLMRKFSFGKQHQIELGGKIIKDSIFGYCILNGLALIFSFLAPYLK